MVVTPDAAQKLIKKYEEEKSLIQKNIDKFSTFVVAISEGDPEKLRPSFDLKQSLEELHKINDTIIRIKHARNIFNTHTLIPDLKITIDEALIRMAMLTKEYNKYSAMGNRQEKERQFSLNRSQDIEYSYTNYDIQYAKEVGRKMYEEILFIQEKLNLVNSTYTFEVALD